jgi:predicted ArsR family transcriptional regulator
LFKHLGGDLFAPCHPAPDYGAERGYPMAMDYEEAKVKIVEELTKKLKSKSKFYFNDLAKILELKPREAKKIVNKLVEEGVLEYWSSGSTSMYGMPGTGKQAHSEGED